MQKVLDFLSDYWLVITPLLYEVIARLKKTGKNYSLLDLLMKMINAIVPNRRTPIIIIFALAMFGGIANAQPWTSHKGIFLNEYDTIINAPIPPAGWAAITSANDSIYGFFGEPPIWQTFGGGAGAGLTTADNGLTVNPAGNVQLGGPLLQTTSITGAFTLNLGTTLSRLNVFALETTGNIFYRRFTDADTFISMLASSSSMSLQNQFDADTKTELNMSSPAIFLRAQDGTEVANIQMRTALGLNHLVTSVDSASIVTSHTLISGLEKSVLSSTAGSTLTIDVSSPVETRITTDAPDLFMTATGTSDFAHIHLDGDAELINFAGSTVGSRITIDASINGVSQMYSAGDLLIYPETISRDFALQTQDGATGTDPSGALILRTGSVTSGMGAVGNISITLGAQAGGGTDGVIQLNVNNGELVFTITRTDCTGAPSGAIANVAGVLNICP